MPVLAPCNPWVAVTRGPTGAMGRHRVASRDPSLVADKASVDRPGLADPVTSIARWVPVPLLRLPDTVAGKV